MVNKLVKLQFLKKFDSFYFHYCIFPRRLLSELKCIIIEDPTEDDTVSFVHNRQKLESTAQKRDSIHILIQKVALKNENVQFS